VAAFFPIIALSPKPESYEMNRSVQSYGNLLISLRHLSIKRVDKLNDEVKCDKFTAISELARRRGFFWSSFEIYGGAGRFETYGP